MRLFILDGEQWEQEEQKFIITSLRIVRHAHVVRLERGEEIALQMMHDPIALRAPSLQGGKDMNVTRYMGVVEEMGKKQLIVKVQQGQKVQQEQKGKNVAMAVALPNTGSKLDMIVEKLTEVGVDRIVFFSAERSQMRRLDDKKLGKLGLVAVEASEQSNRWTVPEVGYVRSLDDVLAMEGEKVLFEKGNHSALQTPPFQGRKEQQSVIGLVGPEGGWIENEQGRMSSEEGICQVGLGDNILRMETAAIVGAYELVKRLRG